MSKSIEIPSSAPPGSILPIDLTTDVTGILPVANGGTGVGSFLTGSVIFMGSTTLAEDNGNFFWDDTNNRLAIGHKTPETQLHILGASNGTVHDTTNQLTIEGEATAGINISTNNSGKGQIFFARTALNNAGRIVYSQGTTQFDLFVEGVNTATIGKATFNVNPAQADYDFIVETKGSASTLFVDGGADRVGIKEAVPLIDMHVFTGSSGIASVSTPGILIEGEGSAALTINVSTVGIASIFLGDSANQAEGQIRYINSTDSLQLGADGIVNFQMVARTLFHFNFQNLGADFRYDGDTNDNVFFINSTTERVGVNTAAPAALVHLDQNNATGAIPVITLDQADVDQEFVRFIGTAAAATLTNSIVAEADVTNATRGGFVKVYVQDDGNQITDQAYYMPVFTLA